MAEQIPFNIAVSIAEKLLTKLGSYAAQEIELACGARKELKKLGDTLTTINDLLLDAEERQEEREHAVKNWVRRFKDVIYDADDLLDDFATYELGRGGMARQVSRFFSSSNQVAYHCLMGHRIKDIRGRLGGIANDVSLCNPLIARATTRVGNTGRQAQSYAVTSEVIGRDEDKEKIIEILLQSNNEENLSVAAIVGIGGLGKTTLAQLVYNDEKVKERFDLRLRVCVSDDFDVIILVRKIIKSAAPDPNVDNLGLEQLINKLHEILTQKRYLLLLDDIWNEDFEKWDQLRTLLKVGATGSKVLVTTRSFKVTSTMRIASPYVLQGLNEGQSWALFKSLAIGDDRQNAHPNLLQIGEEITKMCNGVPLVIKTLGNILHFETEESKWLSIQKNKNLMSLGNGNMLLVLKLSYDSLPSHLKQCFTYYALFPKNYEINKKMLIQLWMAQGYIQLSDEDKELELEDVGDRYFKELLARLMFQKVNNRYKMHDLIYDMARSIVKSEILIIGTKNGQTTILERLHHLSISGWSQGVTDLKEKSLRTLFASDYDDSCANSMVNTLVLNCKCLRVLDLGAGSKAIKLPKSLIKLRHLRYLSLSNGEFEVLPSGFTSLQNLQTLKLLKCEHLKELPRNIRKMINLRHLEIGRCSRLKYMPRRLGELTMLQTLHLEYLDALEYMFENSSSAEPFFFPSLKTLELCVLPNFKGWCCDQLTTLELPSCPSLSTLKVCRCEQLTTLELPSCPSLSTLEVWRCDQLTTLELPSCPSLSTLEIEFCDQLTTLELPSCPSLSELKIYNSDQLTTLELPSCPFLSTLVVFQCKQLTTLELPSCPSLSTLEIEYCDQLTTLELPSCPSLSTLEVTFCDQLTTLELPSCPSLSTLKVCRCEQLTTLELPSCPSLSTLVVFGCKQLTTLELPSCPSLSELKILNSDQLTTLELPSCPFLSKLAIGICKSLESLQLPSLPCLEELKVNGVREEILWRIILVSSSLKYLNIGFMYDLVSLFQGIQHLGALEELRIYDCIQLNLSDKEDDDGGLQFQGLRSLRKLFITGIPKLVSLPKGLQHVTTLETLSIADCDDFTTLPDWISSLTFLSKLKSKGCPRFKLEDRSKIAHIPTIDIF